MNPYLEQFLKKQGYTIELIHELPLSPRHWWNTWEPLTIQKKTIKVLEPQLYQEYKIVLYLFEKKHANRMLLLLATVIPLLLVFTYILPQGWITTTVLMITGFTWIGFIFREMLSAQLDTLKLFRWEVKD